MTKVFRLLMVAFVLSSLFLASCDDKSGSDNAVQPSVEQQEADEQPAVTNPWLARCGFSF